jgi:hypothetical protein
MDTCTSGAQLFISSSRGLEQEGKKNKTKKKEHKRVCGRAQQQPLSNNPHTDRFYFYKNTGLSLPSNFEEKKKKSQGLVTQDLVRYETDRTPLSKKAISLPHWGQEATD